MHGTRMTKIDSHPGRGIQTLCAAYPDTALRRLVLGLPGEHIVVPSLAVVKKYAQGTEKFKSRREALARRLRQQSFRIRPGTLLIHRREQRHPAGHVVVAQTSGRLFDIGLQVKYGVPVFRVAGSGYLRQLLDNVVPFPHKELGQNFIMQPVKQLTLSGDKTAIEQRDSELHVLSVEPVTFGK